MNKPKIIVTGMCDTKFTELKFLAEQVKKAGGEVKIVMLVAESRVIGQMFLLQEVLDVNGIKQEDVFKLPRAEAIKVVGEAGEKKIMQMYEAGEVTESFPGWIYGNNNCYIFNESSSIRRSKSNAYGYGIQRCQPVAW